MSNRKFRGTGVAVVTPFKKGKIDFPSLKKIIEHLIKGGVNYLVPLGTTGESALLSPQEQRKVLNFIIKVNAKRKPIVAGNFGGKNTAQIVEKIKKYNFKGIDAILSASPEYLKPNQEGIFKHYMELQQVSPVPIIIYNVPGRTRSNIEWSTTIKLAKASKKFIGIKEASGDLIQATKIIKNKPRGFLVISGDDELGLPFIACGGDGILSVMANVFPKQFSGMVRTSLKGDFVKARSINMSMYDLHQWLYVEGNPVGIKAAMELKGLCSKEVRLPLYTMSKNNFEKLQECFEGLGLQ